MRKYSSWIAVLLCTVIFGLTATALCQAENLTSPVTITTGNYPKLFFVRQTWAYTGKLQYEMRSYDPGYDVQSSFFLVCQNAPWPDVIIRTTPFWLGTGAPTNSFVITSEGRIGVGTDVPDVNSQMEERSIMANGVLLTGYHSANFTTPVPHYLRVENSLGVFRSGVQSSGDAQFGAFTAGNGLNLLAGGASKVTINSSGQVSIGNPPPPVGTNALATSTGAVLTEAGVWTNNSSRAAKRDIEPITSKQARDTVLALRPVSYRYKNEPDEQYVGFIAEDVPELIATRNRKGLAEMDITAVVTKVIQDQDREQSEDHRMLGERQKLIVALSERLSKLEQKLGVRDDVRSDLPAGHQPVRLP